MVGCNGSLGLGDGTISSHERTTSGHPEPEREALTLVEMKGRKIGKQLASPNDLIRSRKLEGHLTKIQSSPMPAERTSSPRLHPGPRARTLWKSGT